MNLARFVRKREWSELEEAWTELILGDAPIAPAIEAVAAAVQRKEIPRLLPLVREHAEMLKGSGRSREAAELLGETMLLGGSPGELAKPFFEAAQAAWGEEPFWEVYTEIAGLHDNTQDMRSAWRAFQKLLALAPGRVVYHRKGWGLGKIEELDPEEGVARVRFVSGKSDRFPFQTTVDIFEFLDPADLRALVVTDPDRLKHMIAKEPLEVLRWVVRRNDGKATQATIKLAVSALGLEGGRFTAWWRKAKKLADESEWFEVSGPTNKVTVRQLDQAFDPAEGIRRQLDRSTHLGEALTRVRALTTGGAADPAVLAAALETLEALAADTERHSRARRLAVWLFLRDRLGKTPEPLREELSRAASQEGVPGAAPAIWKLFRDVPGRREQERCIELLREVFGAQWLTEAGRNLQHAAPGMVRGLVDALDTAGKREDLVAHYRALLARPAKNPALLVSLTARIEKGEPMGEFMLPMQRAICLLQLGVHLNRAAARDAELHRARTRLSEVLSAGTPTLLERLLKDATIDDLRGIASMLEAGVDRAIDRVFTHFAIRVSPEVFRDETRRPFWEGQGIWTTRAGLAKRQEELRILREIKIPENAEAIGRAASFGDLSENSEWEAAIEDQRHLTKRAMDLETEIRDAQLLENAPIPADRVAPGGGVRYRDADGQEHRAEIVGPWDLERDDQISYRSPLASGMLGHGVGERVQVDLPSGSVEVEILEVFPLA